MRSPAFYIGSTMIVCGTLSYLDVDDRLQMKLEPMVSPTGDAVGAAAVAFTPALPSPGGAPMGALDPGSGTVTFSLPPARDLAFQLLDRLFPDPLRAAVDPPAIVPPAVAAPVVEWPAPLVVSAPLRVEPVEVEGDLLPPRWR